MELDGTPNKNVKAAREAVDISSSCKESEEDTDETERDGNFLENLPFVTQQATPQAKKGKVTLPTKTCQI